MKRYILGLLIGAFGVSIVYLARTYVFAPTNQIHYHAGFTVFIDGKRQDFSSYQYMNFTPCSEHDSKKSPAEEQIEKAHLHDMVGDVVHVHRQGAVWGDLFKNIKYTFPASVTGYVDGTEVKNILDTPILDDESVIFVVGDKAKADLSAYVTLDRIHEVEAKSELCGKN